METMHNSTTSELVDSVISLALIHLLLYLSSHQHPKWGFGVIFNLSLLAQHLPFQQILAILINF